MVHEEEAAKATSFLVRPWIQRHQLFGSLEQEFWGYFIGFMRMEPAMF